MDGLIRLASTLLVVGGLLVRGALFCAAAAVIILATLFAVGLALPPLSDLWGTSARRSVSVAAAAPASAPSAPVTKPSVQWAVVANTDHQGVFLRRTPRMDDRFPDALPDGTRLRIIGEDLDNGIQWKHVEDPKGRQGWVPARYVVGAP